MKTFNVTFKTNISYQNIGLGKGVSIGHGIFYLILKATINNRLLIFFHTFALLQFI